MTQESYSENVNEEALWDEEYLDEGAGIEVIDFYDKNQEQDVENALIEMGFSFLAQKFKEEQIDYQCFENLNSFYISKLLSDFKLGLAMKFEIKYKEWKSGKLQFSNSSNLAFHDTRIMIRDGIIKTILESTTSGRHFLEKNELNVKLERADESELCDLILSHFFSKQQLISTKDFESLVNDIKNLFPKEQPNVYFAKNDKKRSGLLYDKYNNKLKVLRGCQLMPGSSRKRKAEQHNDLYKSLDNYTQEEINSNEFVKYTTANVDFALLESHWRRSSRIRIDCYKQMKDHFFSSVYRALMRPDGHELISIDFDFIYPERNFKTEWARLQDKTVAILMNTIAQESLIKKFQNFEHMTYNQSLAVILLGLHYVLFGDKVSYGDKKKVVYKPTVYDSFGFLLLIVDDEDTMKVKIDDWIRKNIEKQLKQQALIVGFGGSIENLKDKFCLILEDIKYIFDGEFALLYALEKLLQIYHVFNIEYPLLNTSVHTFLSSKFLKINTNSENFRSKITRLINEYNV